jgi:hypothetical protein
MLSAANLGPKPGIQMMIDFAPKSQALGCRGRTSPFSTASREAAPKSNKDDAHHNLRCNTIQLRCNTGLDVKICRHVAVMGPRRALRHLTQSGLGARSQMRAATSTRDGAASDAAPLPSGIADQSGDWDAARHCVPFGRKVGYS